MAWLFLKIVTIANAFSYVHSRIISGIPFSVSPDEIPSGSLRLISRGLIAREPFYLSSGQCMTLVKLSPLSFDKRDNLEDFYDRYAPRDSSFATAGNIDSLAAVQTADTEDSIPTQWTPDYLGSGEEKLGLEGVFSDAGTSGGDLVVDKSSPWFRLDNMQMAE